jgi:hypothetical protein
MKEPTKIKEKIRQLKFAYTKQFYKEHLSREPKNCIYNRTVIFAGTKEHATRVCNYFSDNNVYQICDSLECAGSCNAFVSKLKKKDIKTSLDNDIKNNPMKYPEIMALNWVLEKNVQDTYLTNFKYYFYSKIFSIKEFIKRWIK